MQEKSICFRITTERGNDNAMWHNRFCIQMCIEKQLIQFYQLNQLWMDDNGGAQLRGLELTIHFQLIATQRMSHKRIVMTSHKKFQFVRSSRYSLALLNDFENTFNSTVLFAASTWPNSRSFNLATVLYCWLAQSNMRRFLSLLIFFLFLITWTIGNHHTDCLLISSCFNLIDPQFYCVHT